MAAAATAAQAAAKPKGARSLIVLDVKPYDEETDLKVLALGKQIHTCIHIYMHQHRHTATHTRISAHGHSNT